MHFAYTFYKTQILRMVFAFKYFLHKYYLFEVTNFDIYDLIIQTVWDRAMTNGCWLECGNFFAEENATYLPDFNKALDWVTLST